MTTKTKIIAALALVGCGAPAVPDKPSWFADVQPILKANCMRCHGEDPIGGAPSTFRLDTFAGNGAAPNYSHNGAALLAPFIVARVDVDQMPTVGPLLTDRQKEILRKWALTDEVTSLGMLPTPGVGNQAPTATATMPASADAFAAIYVTIDDPDGDTVRGTLTAGSLTIAPLHDGLNAITWDTGTVPPGVETIHASFSDESRMLPIEQDLGTITVAHASNNTAPFLTIDSPKEFDLLADQLGQANIQLTIADPDDDKGTVSITAFHGDTRVGVSSGKVAGLNAGQAQTFKWDTSAKLPTGDFEFEASASWRLEITVTDARGASRTITSGYFAIEHSTSTDTYSTNSGRIKKIIDDHCAGKCHNTSGTDGKEILDPFLDWTSVVNIQAHKGIMWRKLILRRDMPPKSEAELWPDNPLSESDRQAIGDWLAAGAPQ
jgi:hypothetical protein